MRADIGILNQTIQIKIKKEDKLHDIICMANNLEDGDAYLIYGANDDGTIK